MCSAVCFCRQENLHRHEKTFRNFRKPCFKTCLQTCMQHLHCLLVWFEQFAGELTEDGQEGEVWRCRCFWRLAKLLEHKLYAVPKEIEAQTKILGTKTCKKWIQVMKNKKTFWPVDHDDALTKLDEVPEGKSKPPGQLLDAGEGLDPWVSPTTALLLLFQTNKQLGSGGTIASAPFCLPVPMTLGWLKFIFSDKYVATIPAANRAPVCERSLSYLSVGSCTSFLWWCLQSRYNTGEKKEGVNITWEICCKY